MLNEKKSSHIYSIDAMILQAQGLTHIHYRMKHTLKLTCAFYLISVSSLACGVFTQLQFKFGSRPSSKQTEFQQERVHQAVSTCAEHDIMYQPQNLFEVIMS